MAPRWSPGPVTRRGLRLDLPARTQPHGGINAPLLGYLLYRFRTGATCHSELGLIGAPLQIASVTAAIFGLHDHPGSVWSAIATAPIFVWELSLDVWLVVKGFRSSPVRSTTVPTGPGQTPQPVA